MNERGGGGGGGGEGGLPEKPALCVCALLDYNTTRKTHGFVFVDTMVMCECWLFTCGWLRVSHAFARVRTKLAVLHSPGMLWACHRGLALSDCTFVCSRLYGPALRNHFRRQPLSKPMHGRYYLPLLRATVWGALPLLSPPLQSVSPPFECAMWQPGCPFRLYDLVLFRRPNSPWSYRAYASRSATGVSTLHDLRRSLLPVHQHQHDVCATHSRPSWLHRACRR